MPRFRVSLEGFPTSEYDVANQERAWDAYKMEHGNAVRRRSHTKTPKVESLDESLAVLPSIAVHDAE